MGHTPKSTSRLHRTMPIPPPSTVTGAESDMRTWSRNASCNISNVNVSCPDVLVCIAAIRRQRDGYVNANNESCHLFPSGYGKNSQLRKEKRAGHRWLFTAAVSSDSDKIGEDGFRAATIDV